MFSLPSGLAPASWQGSNFPKVSTFPGTPCRELACAPLWLEGELPNAHALGPGMDMSSQGTAHCCIPPFCQAGAVHPPLSRGRAVPHAFCDRCAGKGMAASGLSAAAGGGQAALTSVGSGSQTPPGCLAAWGAPGPVVEEGSSRGPEASLGILVCSSPGFLHVTSDVWMKHVTCPVPLSSEVLDTDTLCAALPAHFWRAVAKS